MSDFDKELTRHKAKISTALNIYANSVANNLEGEAKRGAKWTDRTGLARKTITSRVEQNKNGVVIHLQGNVKYFKYLEEYRGSKYAILKPTIRNNSRRVRDGLITILK